MSIAKAAPFSAGDGFEHRCVNSATADGSKRRAHGTHARGALNTSARFASGDLMADTDLRIAARIAGEISAAPQQAQAAIALLDEGSTVPFIARYRKEATGGLDDAQLRALDERLRLPARDSTSRRASRARIHASSQGKLSTPRLKRADRGVQTAKARLEGHLPALQAQAPHQGRRSPSNAGLGDARRGLSAREP